MLLNYGVEEDSWESLGLQGDPTSPSQRRSVLCVHWKNWGWIWNSNTLATWCEELTHLKRPWCWERLKAGGEGDDRGWDVWMASLTQWRWVWVDSGSWWWTRRPEVLWSIRSRRIGHDWATELNWNKALAQVVLVVKNLPANAGDIREDTLEEGIESHSSILAEESHRQRSHRVTKTWTRLKQLNTHAFTETPYQGS